MADGTSTPAANHSIADPHAAANVDLRPLTTSELIDRGFALYRNNFVGLLLLALLCQVAPMLSQLLGTLFNYNITPTSFNDMVGKPGQLSSLTAIFIITTLVSQVVVFCFEVVIAFYISDAYLGKIPSVKSSLRRLLTCIGASIWTCILNRLLIGLTFLFPLLAMFAIYAYVFFYPPDHLGAILVTSIGAILLLVASLIPVLVIFMRLMVTVPVLALESLSGWKAIKRSFTLVRYDPGLGILYWGEMRLSFLLLPLFVIELLLLSITSLPLFLQHGSSVQVSAPPDSMVILSQILIFTTSSLILPLYSIATTLFYYDVRIRREGFDLEFMAQNMEKAP